MRNMDQLEASLCATIKPSNLKDAMSEAAASSGELWRLPFDQLLINEDFNLRVHNTQYTAKTEEEAESAVQPRMAHAQINSPPVSARPIVQHEPCLHFRWTYAAAGHPTRKPLTSQPRAFFHTALAYICPTKLVVAASSATRLLVPSTSQAVQ